MESKTIQDKLGILMCLPSYQFEEKGFGDWLYLGSDEKDYWLPGFIEWLKKEKPDLVKRIEIEQPWELIEDIAENNPFWEDGKLGFERELLMCWVEFIMNDPNKLASIKDQLLNFFDEIEIIEPEWKCREVDLETTKKWFNEIFYE